MIKSNNNLWLIGLEYFGEEFNGKSYEELFCKY